MYNTIYNENERLARKMYNVYWYRSYSETFLSRFLIFTSFNTTPVILSVKDKLNSKLQVDERCLIQVG